MQFPV